MNSFGRIFRITLFGESHGTIIGITIDGVPAGIGLNLEDFTHDLSRRKAGEKGTTSRIEPDRPEIISGWFNNTTTGAPLTIIFRNTNTDSTVYDQIKEIPRPGHADFVASKKFGHFNDYRGGGHFSGRLTLALVAAGVIAKKMIPTINIQTEIINIRGNTSCFDETLDDAISKNDSIGGTIECRVRNIPVGWGEPFFDSVESIISHLAFSIPGIKGIEFGAGFAATSMYGSQHNDIISDQNGTTVTNHAGGISGGITNGNELVFRVAVKPTASIKKSQESYNFETNKTETFKLQGHHDTCIALRIPVIIESITAIALTDFSMLYKKLTVQHKGK